MTQALREEINTTGVRITNIQPGDVKSELTLYTTDKEGKDTYDMQGMVVLYIFSCIAGVGWAVKLLCWGLRSSILSYTRNIFAKQQSIV